VLVFLFALTAAILAAGAVDSRRRHRSGRPRPSPHGFAIVDALVIGLLMCITAAVLVLAIANIRSV
jgi:drug/metabolite transporter (DMT)-like permease